MFNPKDDFATRMLSSIPKKTLNWLKFLEIQIINADDPTSFEFKRNDLEVTGVLADDVMIAGTIKTKLGAVNWTGHYENTDTIQVNSEALADVQNNLHKFIQFEASIYDELKELQKERSAALVKQRMELQDESKDL